MSNVGLIEVAIEEEVHDLHTPLQKRIFANKIRRMLDEIDPPPPEKEKLTTEFPPMTEQEAHEFGFGRILYGKYKDRLYCDIDDQYLGWLCDAKRDEWKKLRAYLAWRNLQ